MTTPRPPAPLPRSVRAMLAAYRDAHELPDAARDRIWSVVGADDAPAPALDPAEHPSSASDPAAARPRHARWLGWGAGALAAAAVLALAWQLGGTLAERRRAERAPDAAVMHGDGGSTQGHASPAAPRRPAPGRSETEASIVEPDSAAPSPALPGAASPALPGSMSPALPGSTSSAPPGSTAPTPAPPGSTTPSPEPTTLEGEPPRSRHPEPTTPEPASTLAAERELVARAWGALALGETTPALEAAAEHARRFPAGLLAPERAAIETIARCRRGDADGPRRAAAFHRAHPRSPLAERVDEACAAPSPESTSP